MKNRPLSITIISWMCIAAGSIGIAYHAPEFIAGNAVKAEVVWIFFIRLLAILGGVFLLRGSNWARWLLVLWVGYHVILSVFHTPLELALHSLLFAGILFFLFRAPASRYFRNATTTAPKASSEGIDAA